MANTKLTQQEKMDLWYKHKRILNIHACSDSKLLENLRICCDSGYFLQATLLRKEMYSRGLECSLEHLSSLPDDYYTTRNTDEIGEDLITFIHAYISEHGDSVDNRGLFVGKDTNIMYYGWDEMYDWNVKVDVNKGLVYGGQEVVDYTKNMSMAIELIKRELFGD